MKHIFFTFGNWKYYESAEYLAEAAKKYVDDVIIFKEADIPSSFYKKNLAHFVDGRGFGYWVWKSYFIQQLLNDASDDDIFMYADAGNAIIDDITPLYNICKEDEKGVILFDNSDGHPNNEIHKNNIWTKSDCFNLMGLSDDRYVYGNQVNASYILFRKTDFCKKFFNVYLEACQNYNIISDAPNVTSDFNKDFRDHRHDQSILSLMAIRYNVTIERDPSQWGMSRWVNESKYNQLFNHHRKGLNR